MPPEDRRKKVRPDPASQRLPGEVLGLALNVVVAAFLFGFLGRWVGTKIGGQDYLTLLGGFIGAAAGFYSLYMHLTTRPEDRGTKKSE